MAPEWGLLPMPPERPLEGFSGLDDSSGSEKGDMPAARRSRRRGPAAILGTPIAALAAVVLAGGGAAATASPPPRDGVVDLLTEANAEIIGPGGLLAIGGGGDVNGDGRGDILVGFSGSVWALAWRAQPVDVDLAAPGPLALARIDGAASGDRLGTSVALAGDLNGDGAADILVGAPGADNNGRVDSGSVYVVFGGAGLAAVDLTALGASGARIDGAAPDQGVGGNVKPAGDVNGDGLADVLLSAGSRVGETVYVVFGARGFGDVDLATPGPRAMRITGGYGFDGAGDVDGDGYGDVIVGGEPIGLPNRAFVVFGSRAPTDVDLAAPAGRAIRILGRADESIFGVVAGAGDVNGDGFDDVAVNAPRSRHRAAGIDGFYAIKGGPRRADIDLAAPGSRATRFVPGVSGYLGLSLAAVGDVDGNGYDDLAVGARAADFAGRVRAGSVMVLLGGPRFFRSATRTAAPGGGGILRVVGPFPNAGVGWVERAGDTDGDGRAEIVVAGSVWAHLKGRARTQGAWLYGYGPTRPCAVVPRTGARSADEPPDPIRLTRGQLVINQRIGQAAIRRVAAVEQRLDEGIRDRDVCGGTISSQSLVATLTPAYGAEIALPSADPEPITTAPAGDPTRVRLTPQQLLINQRVYQVALLRARALAGRLSGRLTGGDVGDGGLARGRLTPGLTVSATGAAASSPPSRSNPRIPSRQPGSKKVTLSASQLAINQRIAQAAVRTANDAVAQIERGLVNSNFADRSIGADALAPGVVTSP